jgi:hypothetical protein
MAGRLAEEYPDAAVNVGLIPNIVRLIANIKIRLKFI